MQTCEMVARGAISVQRGDDHKLLLCRRDMRLMDHNGFRLQGYGSAMLRIDSCLVRTEVHA